MNKNSKPKTVEENGFKIVKYNKKDVRAIEYLGNDKVVVIPDGVTSIGYKLFYKNKTIEEVIIPNSVQFIEDCAFSQCSNLKKINIPKVKGVYYGKYFICSCYKLETSIIVDVLLNHNIDVRKNMARCCNKTNIDAVSECIFETLSQDKASKTQVNNAIDFYTKFGKKLVADKHIKRLFEIIRDKNYVNSFKKLSSRLIHPKLLKDDVSVMEYINLYELSSSEIDTLLDLCIKNNCNQCTAELLNYKSEKLGFSSVDNMFSLD